MINFHETLKYYSQADDPQDLASKILNEPSLQNVTSSSDVAERVSIAVEKFLHDNEKQIAKFDLPALEELAGLVNTLTTWTKGVLQQDKKGYLNALEKTMDASIKIAMNPPDLVREINPESETSLEDIFSIVDEHLSFQDLIKLHISGKDISSDTLKQAAANIQKNDLIELKTELLKQYEKDPKKRIFKEMINIFFQNAPSVIHPDFFSLWEMSPLQDVVIAALPKDLTHLNLRGCKWLKDQHVGQIVNRLNNLRTLNLSECPRLTNTAVTSIANSENMANLRMLAFVKNLSDEDVVTLASSEYMANLRVLDFSESNVTVDGIRALAISEYITQLQTLKLNDCIDITDEAVITISNFVNMTKLSNSPNLANLQKLSFAGCEKITDKSAKELVRSFFQLQELNLTGCNLKNENGAVTELVTSHKMRNMRILSFASCEELNDEAAKAIANSDYMHKLEYLYLNGCIAMTDDAFASIAQSNNLGKLQELHLSETYFTDVAAKALAESSNLSNLTFMDLSWSLVTDKGVNELITTQKLPKLRNLVFNHCRISPQGSKALEAWESAKQEAV